MSLQNLKPAEALPKDKGNVWAVVKVPVKVEQLQEDTKGLSPGQGTQKDRFEGGQMPLQRRVPKFGFKNVNRVDYKGINLDTIQNLLIEKKVKKEVTFDKLVELRLVGKNELVKILCREN